MRQAEVVIALTECKLVIETAFRLCQLDDLASQRRHMLAHGEIEAFDEGGVDYLSSTTVLEDGFNHFPAAVDQPLRNADNTAFFSLFDQLGIVQVAQGDDAEALRPNVRNGTTGRWRRLTIGH